MATAQRSHDERAGRWSVINRRGEVEFREGGWECGLYMNRFHKQRATHFAQTCVSPFCLLTAFMRKVSVLPKHALEAILPEHLYPAQQGGAPRNVVSYMLGSLNTGSID